MKFKELSPSIYAEEFIRSTILTKADGAMVDSQREMATNLGVSRNAIKYALKRLQHDGDIRVVNRQGVEVNKKRDVNLLSMAPMSSALKSTKMCIKHLATKVVEVPSDLVDFFGSVTSLAEIKRVRLYDGVVFSFELAYLDEQKFSNIAHVDFNERSLYEVLEKRYNELPTYGYENITCVLADETLAEILNVAIKTPLYRVDSFNYAEDDDPIEHTSQFLPANKIKYHFRAKNIFDYQEDEADDII